MTDTTITQEAPPETQDAAIDPSEYASAKAQVDALSAELERYKAKAHAEGLERKKQEQAARMASEKAAKQSGDVEALERSWAEKLAARETELASEVANLKTVIFAKTVGAEAINLAAKLAMDGCAEGLEPHIRARLITEWHDGIPEVRVTDKTGRPSAMTLADLEKELKATPYLAPLIKGSQASGSGHKGQGAHGGPPGTNVMRRADFDALDSAAKYAFMRNKGTLTD